MLNPFKVGDTKTFEKIVAENETATFESGTVHPFYATFALARDAEWATRLFVLEMKEDDEEGIGTFVNVTHKTPAMVGDSVIITATIIAMEGNSIDCSFEARVGDRIIASGDTGQKILKKKKLEQIVANL